jgi:hypothetical protein
MRTIQKFYFMFMQKAQHIYQVKFRITAAGDNRITADGNTRITADSDY